MTTPPIQTLTDELLGEIERTCIWRDVSGIELVMEELRTLRAENAELRKDAGRYEWISTATPYRFKKIQDAALTDGGDCMYFHRDRFDAEIDQAMEQAK